MSAYQKNVLQQLGNLLKINFFLVYHNSVESAKAPVYNQLSHSECKPTCKCLLHSFYHQWTCCSQKLVYSSGQWWLNFLLWRPNSSGANVTKFFTLATKFWKLVAKLATRMFHQNPTKRYSELKRFAKIIPVKFVSKTPHLKLDQ